jgi:exopolyphosphatase/guanosine-5'-triphosphate,3'-diphosphate pyrophosphatase
MLDAGGLVVVGGPLGVQGRREAGAGAGHVLGETLREARNRDDFLLRARTVLGFRIDVISGREEARLIYQGVAHLLPPATSPTTNAPGGRHRRPLHRNDPGPCARSQVMESYRVGSVSLVDALFPGRPVQRHRLPRRQVACQGGAGRSAAADLCARPVGEAWARRAPSAPSRSAGRQRVTAPGASRPPACDWLYRAAAGKAGSVDKIDLPGLKEDRRAVIGRRPVRAACLVFDLLGIDELKPAQGALRQGALFDLDERDGHRPLADARDTRAHGGRGCTRFAVDCRAGQARRQRLALSLYEAGQRRRCAARNCSASWAGPRAARDRHDGLAQRLPQAWRLHPGDNADAPGFAQMSCTA